MVSLLLREGVAVREQNEDEEGSEGKAGGRGMRTAYREERIRELRSSEPLLPVHLSTQQGCLASLVALPLSAGQIVGEFPLGTAASTLRRVKPPARSLQALSFP